MQRGREAEEGKKREGRLMIPCSSDTWPCQRSRLGSCWDVFGEGIGGWRVRINQRHSDTLGM